MENAAPGGSIGDTLSLEAQIIDDSSKGLNEIAPKEKVVEEEQKPESKPKEDAPADPSGESDEKPEVAPLEEDETPEEKKDESEVAYKIGSKQFGDVKDVVREANRLMGHNSNLVGQINTIKSQAEEAQTQLAEAIKVNQQWVDWYNKSQNGEDDKEESPAPAKKEAIIDPVAIAKQIKEELNNDKKRDELIEMYKTQHASVEATSNYYDIVETYNALSDKINPLTSNYFTPTEAYEFACKHHGLDSELTSDSKKEKAPLKTVANPEAIKKAARPRTDSSLTPAPKNEKDWVDDVLTNAFPTL